MTVGVGYALTMSDALLASRAVHDLDHTAQIYATLAGSHDAAVGPRKPNLCILLRRDQG